MTFQLPQGIAESDAAGILTWASSAFAESIVFTSSFEDPVLVHLVAVNAPSVPIVLLDTQYLFPETLAYAEELQRLLKFDLQVVRPMDSVIPDDQWKVDVDACCGRRKVEPLDRVLSEKSAWITGIRRVDAPTRANAPAVSRDLGRGVTKVNPVVAWSDLQMETYAHVHDLPLNPLVERGYASIGCWPCTRPVEAGEDRRAGRWSGNVKTECGLHVS